MHYTHEQFLGGMPVETFLREYWQKKPLLVRQAIPGFAGVIDRAGLRRLAMSDEMVSRLVQFDEAGWHLSSGPFTQGKLARLKGCWTLLVQNLNHALPEAEALFNAFNFIPYARLDDLMVSDAPEGGTVGPHFDSYDVFLLQAGGPKRWQIAADCATTLVEGAPLKILNDFMPEEEYVLEPGDMLYLPPRYAHYGVAMAPGMTYSIGFRAPTHQELAKEFLGFVADHLELEGLLADPDLAVQTQPAALPANMIRSATALLNEVRWTEQDVSNFLGCYLSEPKPHVFFSGPARDLSLERFSQRLQTQGLRLDAKAIMLHHQGHVFLNGEALVADGAEWDVLVQLANTRELPAGTYGEVMQSWLLEAFNGGVLHWCHRD